MMKPYGRKTRPHGVRSAGAQYGGHQQAPPYYSQPPHPPQLADYPTAAAVSAAQAAAVYPSPYPPLPPTAAYFPPTAQTPYYSYEADKRTVEEMVRRQIEYYFSDENLIKDVFLRNKMDKDGYVQLNEIAQFQRVMSLTQDMETISNALKESDTVEICDGIKIRPKKEPLRWPFPNNANVVQFIPHLAQQAAVSAPLQMPPQAPMMLPQLQSIDQQHHTTRLSTQQLSVQQSQQPTLGQSDLAQNAAPITLDQEQNNLNSQNLTNQPQQPPVQPMPQQQHKNNFQQLQTQQPNLHPQQQQSQQPHNKHHHAQSQQRQQQQNQTHTHPGQSSSDASSPNNSNTSDISSVANNVDNSNRSSFTYATAVTNNKQPKTEGHNDHQTHQLPQSQPLQQQPSPQQPIAHQHQRPQQQSVTPQPQPQAKHNSAQQQSYNKHQNQSQQSQKQNSNQSQSQQQQQQQPIGDISLNSKHNKSTTPVESEWKEVKSRRRRSGKA